MQDQEKSKQRLIEELEELRARVAALESSKDEDAVRGSEGTSEERFRSLVETTNDFIWELDAKRVFVYASPGVKDLLGYEPEEILGKTPFDLMPPEEIGRIRKLAEELDRSPRRVDAFDAVNLHKDGRRVIVETRGVRVLDADGKQRSRGIGRDVTQRRRMEEELRKERDTVDKIISLNPYSIGIFDKDGHILRWNKAFLDLCIVPPPREYSIFNDPIVKKNGFHEDLLKVKAGKTCIVPEIWYNTRDVDSTAPDNPRCLNVVNFPIMDSHGDLDFVVVLTQDITERKKAEEALRNSEELFRAVFESSSDCILVWDKDYNYLYANQAAMDYVGTTRENVIGKNIRDGLGHIPDFMRLWMSRIDQVFATGEPMRVEDSGPVADRLVHSESILSPIRDETGNVFAVGVVYRDVTARKLAEEARRKEQRHLQRLLDMHEQNRKLVAYEIHDGLAQSLIAAKMLLETAAAGIDARGSDHERTSCQRGLNLLGLAVEQARALMAGQRPMILDEHGLIAAIDFLVSDNQYDGTPKITFTHDVEFERLAAPLETAVFRIVQESLTNARRHSHSKTVRIRLTQSETNIRVEIEDQGIGFDPDQIAEECFGLEGLRERTRLFGGQATITSAPDQGTRITVELPLVRE